MKFMKLSKVKYSSPISNLSTLYLKVKLVVSRTSKPDNYVCLLVKYLAVVTILLLREKH